MRPGTTSYAYTIETKSGKILSGVVNAGETILAPIGEYILKVDIVPNYVEVGASTKYGGAVDNIIKDNVGNRQADDPDIFEALGTLSDAMNTMAVIPPDTVLTTKIAVFSPDFNNNTYHTLSIDQKVQGLDQLKASIGAWRWQTKTMYNPKNTDPNYYGKFDTHSYRTGYTTDRIYEPIIYYVLPKFFSYSRGWDGVQYKTTDDSGKVVVPKYSTYVVDGRQVVKFDYTGTGYSLYTQNQSTNQIFIMMDPDAVAGKYPYDVYMYTRTGLINYNTKYTSSNVTDLVNQYTGNVMTSSIPGSLYKLNTVYENYFVVDKQIITYVPVTSQGNQNPKSVLVGTSDDKGDNTLSYYLNIANYDSNDLSAARLLIDLPQKSDGASSYDVHLSGPIVYDKSYGNLSDDAYTILYSTNTQNLPSSSVKGTQTSLEGYVPADQVTDWSQIKSIIVVFNESIPSQDYVGRFIVKGTDPTFKEDAGRGWRKVVASPKPVDIKEINTIRTLLNDGQVVVAAGGGGIPVVKEADGSLSGVEAVIDKDFASQRLAELVEADLFIVLTGVDYVFVNYNKPDQAKLEHVNVAQLEEYIKQDQFAPGSMLPKVEAAIAFVNGRPEGKAVITSLENLGALIESESGTIIQKD